MEDNKFNYSLIEQYCNAYGYDYKELYNDSLKKDYLNWLKERKEIGNKYLNYLYEIRKDILERTTAEVGKTDLDTITKPFNTTVISPYEYNNLDDNTRFIPASVFVKDEEIRLYLKVFEHPRMLTLPRNLKLVMTQNPYSPYSILDWDTLHNSGNYDIAVGIYGSIYDKDIKDKLKLLKSLKEKILFGDYIYRIDTDKDNYYAALVSDRKQKVLK